VTCLQLTSRLHSNLTSKGPTVARLVHPHSLGGGSERMTRPESQEHERSPGWTVFVAEMQCFLCGTLAGAVESDRRPLPAVSTWQPADGGPRRLVEWRQLRCTRCGGALLAESIEAVVRHTAPEEQPHDAPRRGRPPKWLVEERRQAHDAAETLP
jgi:hypothetical protein